jgi:penicillin-binding protein 1C
MSTFPKLQWSIKGTAKKTKTFVKWSVISGVLLFLLFLLANRLFPLPDKLEYSTVITDDKGNILHAFLTRDQQWRMKAEPGEISPLLRKTIVAKEDRYFYYHPGINPIAIGRALLMNIFHRRRTSGASTITMQVARALAPKRRTYFNKCLEAFRAMQLEWSYSKDQILQLYLNLLPYGGNIQGVKTAALLYFQKDPDHLSLAEITALAIIPNRPSSLVMGRDNDRIVRERNKWLARFARDRVFTGKEIADALNEPLTAARGRVPQYIPHLALRLKATGNTLIRTHIALNTQLKIEQLAANYVRDILSAQNIRQASVLVLDNTTGQVVAYVGSTGFNNVPDSPDGGQVDGIRAVREPGSTLKPFLYGLCIDAGLLTPKAVIEDVPINYQGYAPENYDRRFNGYVSMEYALEHSLNIPAVKSLQRLGKDRLISVLTGCRFRQIQKDRGKLGLSMILGGCGATLEELTGIYSSLAHEGTYTPPSFYVGDGQGAAAARARSDTGRAWSGQVHFQVMSPAAAFMINDILSRVNRPDFPINWQTTAHLPKIAWKTGTSYGRRDAWSIGYNSHYTVGVWVGNFSGQGSPSLSGASVATPLLFQVFNTIDYDNGQEWFHQPPGCDTRIVCSETGLPPSDHCTDLVSDYFIPLVSSSETCHNWEKRAVSPDEKMSYCRYCTPAAGYKEKWYRILSPDMQAYYDENHIVYQKIPPHNPACEVIFKDGAPSILSPAQGTEYFISRKKPEPLQLSCRTSGDVAKVYWYINNIFYKSGDAHTRQFFIPSEGPVKISCTDDKGRNRDIWIRVKWVDL